LLSSVERLARPKLKAMNTNTRLLLQMAAELLTELQPEVIYPEPMAEEWPSTVPAAFCVGVDIEVGDE
jgi:hypothetical protein